MGRISAGGQQEGTQQGQDQGDGLHPVGPAPQPQTGQQHDDYQAQGLEDRGGAGIGVGDGGHVGVLAHHQSEHTVAHQHGRVGGRAPDAQQLPPVADGGQGQHDDAAGEQPQAGQPQAADAVAGEEVLAAGAGEAPAHAAQHGAKASPQKMGFCFVHGIFSRKTSAQKGGGRLIFRSFQKRLSLAVSQ